jgi:replicative DNA helicase
MGSKYKDTRAAVRVLGELLNRPELLDESNGYFFRAEDFTDELHRIIVSAANGMYKTGGVERFTPELFDSYLSSRPQAYAVFKANNGPEWVAETMAMAEEGGNFDFYYQRLKKMTLLRSYESVGMNLNWLYDPEDVFDNGKREEQERRLDEMSLSEIADEIDVRMQAVRSSYVDNSKGEATLVGEGLEELLDSLAENPDVGPPMYGKFVNTITRGARPGKYYLRSAATNVGKTRTMIADACNFACDEIYDVVNHKWKSLGEQIPTLYISVEQEKDEIQTMALAFISGVNEAHILDNDYAVGELERVMRAVEVLAHAPLYIECLPDYSLKDVENLIKRNLRVNKCQMVLFDYIATSMSILAEVSSKSGVAIREDNVLFLLSAKLKDIAVQYGVWILSATQLNGSYKTEDVPDQTLLRGAKSIADRADCGMILMDVTEKDREMLQDVLVERGMAMPNIKMSVYKNRRGQYNKLYLWMYADKGTCRYDGAFATDYQYNLITMADVEVE